MTVQYCRKHILTIQFLVVMELASDIEQNYYNDGVFEEPTVFLGCLRTLLGMLRDMGQESPELVEAQYALDNVGIAEDGVFYDREATSKLHSLLPQFYVLGDLLVSSDLVIVDVPSMTRIEVR